MFIYIASSDLIPTIHEESKRKVGHIAAALLLLGIVTVGVTTAVAHKYIDGEHTEEPHTSQACEPGYELTRVVFQEPGNEANPKPEDWHCWPESEADCRPPSGQTYVTESTDHYLPACEGDFH